MSLRFLHYECVHAVFKDIVFYIVLSTGIPHILKPDILQTDKQSNGYLFKYVCVHWMVCRVPGLQCVLFNEITYKVSAKTEANMRLFVPGEVNDVNYTMQMMQICEICNTNGTKFISFA